MKKIALLLYLLIVVAASALIALMNRGPNVTLSATRALPAFHLLKPGDLQLKADGRQYLSRPLKEGETIDSNDITILDDAVTADDAVTGGDTATNSGEIPVAITLDRETIASLKIDRDKDIFLCPLKVPVVVRSIHCGDPGAPCIVIAAAAVADADKLKGAEQELSVLAGENCK